MKKISFFLYFLILALGLIASADTLQDIDDGSAKGTFTVKTKEVPLMPATDSREPAIFYDSEIQEEEELPYENEDTVQQIHEGEKFY